MPTHTESMSSTANAISRWRRSLHWLSALFVIGLLITGLWMTRADVSTPQAVADNVWRFSLHKTMGLIILVLTVLRLLSMWSGRGFSHSAHGRWETFAARTVQGYFLTALVLMPATGLLVHYFAGSGAPIWGLPAHWLHASVSDPEQVDSMVGVHHFLAWGMLVALFAHVAGALKHHVIDKDATLMRMLGQPGPVQTARMTVDGMGKAGQWTGIVSALVLAVSGAILHQTEPMAAQPVTALVSQGTDYLSIDTRSELKIKAVQGGEAFEAFFKRFSVSVVGGEQGVPGSIDVSIDSGSFASGLGSRDETAIGADWLDASAFALSSYSTTSISPLATGDFPLQGDGQLTIREVNTAVTIEFAWTVAADDPTQRRLQGRAEFDRFSIELGRGEFGAADAAGNLIQVEFDVMLKQNNQDQENSK